MTIIECMISKPILRISAISLIVILILGIGSIAKLLNPAQQQVVYGQEESFDTTESDAPGTTDSSTGGEAISGCHPSTEVCTLSDLLLNDDDTVLCDPSQGTDCSPYLNQPTSTPTQGPSEQANDGRGTTNEFDWLTGGDPNVPVINKTDPPGQYCNPIAETCDAAAISPGSCFIDITTHSSVCDYSNVEAGIPGPNSTEGTQSPCDPTVASCLPEETNTSSETTQGCDPTVASCLPEETTTPTQPPSGGSNSEPAEWQSFLNMYKKYSDFNWDPNDFPGNPTGPNEGKASQMLSELNAMLPERRANSGPNAVLVKSQMTPELWDYVDKQMSLVPGQSPHKLNKHALESFNRMFTAAKNDGINLVIGDSDRSHATSVANAAKSGNPNAVASFSTHNLGLAIDFSIPGFATSTIPMSKLIQERLSPVYKWLFLHAKEYGWYPYQNEPWHWEYNPEGFKEVFMSEFQ